MNFRGFTVQHEGQTFRYGVIEESYRANLGYPVHYYPDGGVGTCDRHEGVTVVHGGPETFGDSQAYYEGPLSTLND